MPLIKPDFGFDCVVIYIREAHPDADWPIGTAQEYAVARQPVSMKERFSAMMQLKSNLSGYNDASVSLYADSMENTVQQLLNAWPTRFFLFVDGVLALRSHPGDDAHLDLFEFLQECQCLMQKSSSGKSF